MTPQNDQRRQRGTFLLLTGLFATLSQLHAGVGDEAGTAAAPMPTDDAAPFHGALLSAEKVTPQRLATLKATGVTAVALPIHDDPDSRRLESSAFRKIAKAGLAVYYWVEVARCPELADAHPAWMASLQGHDEWRRLFPDPPTPARGEVVKTYPWVPVLSREPFNGQLARIKTLLGERPVPDGVFLNDLQGAPSACGCGSHLCRWTSDYGPLRSTTPLESDAPARFVAAIRRLVPQATVIPVWTTECEEHDGAHDGLCAGVGCFKGICWKAYTAQLMPVARESNLIGVMLPYRSFQRDLPIYGEEAGWIRQAIASFATMPPQHQGQPIPAKRLIAVIQGWDVSEEAVAQQIRVARKADVGGLLVAWEEIEQAWQPRVVKVAD